MYVEYLDGNADQAEKRRYKRIYPSKSASSRLIRVALTRFKIKTAQKLKQLSRLNLQIFIDRIRSKLLRRSQQSHDTVFLQFFNDQSFL